MSSFGALTGAGCRCGLFNCLHLDGRDLLDAALVAGRHGRAWQKVKPLHTLDPEDLQGFDRSAADLADAGSLGSGQRTDGQVVHIRPEFVVEIELDGVQVSSRYPGGVALRFARVLRISADKNAGDANTIDAVCALLTISVRGDSPAPCQKRFQRDRATRKGRPCAT